MAKVELSECPKFIYQVSEFGHHPEDAWLDADHQPALVDWGQRLLGRARSETARDPEGLPCSAAQMGCGTNIRLALPQSPPEQSL